MKVAYFDCFAGASGDMVLGALVDAGLDLGQLDTNLRRVALGGYRLSSHKVLRGAISGTKVDVILEDQQPAHRSLHEILELIDVSPLSSPVKEQSSRVFERLAAAEAKVHGIDIQAVAFHEVGAVDAMVDVIGSILGLHLLGVEKVFTAPFPLGGGTVASAHGLLPVPAPATLELIAAAKAPVRASFLGESELGEMVTPTAAAILTTIASFERPAFALERIGYGAGSRNPASFPNVLGLWLGEMPVPASGHLVLLETNIDDMIPELYGYVMERLFALGARDVWFTPIQMKKNRPATMLSVLAAAENQAAIIQAIMQETSTLGIRVQTIERHELQREEREFESSLGSVKVKVKHLPDGSITISPEYEVCRELALKHGLPLQEVYRLLMREAEEKLAHG